MFPEIARDEIFRLETRRLWLRWAAQGDIDDRPVTSATAAKTAIAVDHRAPGLTCAWHLAMRAGTALHLALETKTDARTAVGLVHLAGDGSNRATLTYSLHPDHRGQGLATEAVQAILDFAFMTGAVDDVKASTPVIETVSRGVLERCGFTYAGTGMSRGDPGSALSACDHFRLHRKTWRSLKGWGSIDFEVLLDDPSKRFPQPLHSSTAVPLGFSKGV